MNMKIQVNKLALAAAMAAAILYAVCWVFVATMPDLAMSVTEDMFHMQMDGFAWKMTPRTLAVGCLAWAVSTGAAVWLGGTLYAWLSRRSGPVMD